MENIRPFASKVVAAAVSLCLATSASVCFAPVAQAREVAGVTVDRTNAVAHYGNLTTISATITSVAGTGIAADNVTWSVSNPKLATIVKTVVDGDVSTVFLEPTGLGGFTVTATFTDVYGNTKTADVYVDAKKATQWRAYIVDTYRNGTFTWKKSAIDKKARHCQLKVKGVKGKSKVRYKLIKGNKKIVKISKKGRLTFTKGTKVGTYKFKVKAIIGANKYHKKTVIKKKYVLTVWKDKKSGGGYLG